MYIKRQQNDQRVIPVKIGKTVGENTKQSVLLPQTFVSLRDINEGKPISLYEAINPDLSHLMTEWSQSFSETLNT